MLDEGGGLTVSPLSPTESISVSKRTFRHSDLFLYAALYRSPIVSGKRSYDARLENLKTLFSFRCSTTRYDDADGAGNMVATNTLASLSNVELIKGLQLVTELAAPILVHSPDIVMEPRFWICTAKIRNAVFDVLLNNPDKWPAAISAMIAAGTDNFVKPAFDCFGFEIVWNVLAQVLDGAKNVKPPELYSGLSIRC